MSVPEPTRSANLSNGDVFKADPLDNSKNESVIAEPLMLLSSIKLAGVVLLEVFSKNIPFAPGPLAPLLTSQVLPCFCHQY
jgi:hypothetical protein